MDTSNISFSRRGFIGTTIPAAASVALSNTGVADAQEAASSAGRVGPAPVPVTLAVNGRTYPLQIEPRVTLLDALRDRLGLTGSKKGCDQGQCGACTVLVDGRRVNACLTLAITTEGKQITTVEGLERAGQLHPLQQAFIDNDAFQCGYCTPGQLCSGVGAIAEGRTGSDEQIRETMSGNICRCGAYTNIVKAVKAAATA